MKQAAKKRTRNKKTKARDDVIKVRSRSRHRRGGDDPRVLRFRKSERMVHWALAIPFLVCYTTALILVIFYNPDPLRPFRALFSWIHRVSGICLIVLPMLAVVKSRGDYRIHFYNIRQAWVWVLDDLKWLALMGIAAINSRVSLPEQGKFNAAEKLNFMMLMTTYPLYILTGLTIWLTDCAFLSWIVHSLMAVIGTPLVLGHIFMATVNPSTRKGLPGMISGLVDRQWAKHHYGRWYRENFERSGSGETVKKVGRRTQSTSSPKAGKTRGTSSRSTGKHNKTRQARAI